MKMTRKALSKKIDEGRAEINAYSADDENLVDVSFFNSSGHFTQRINVELKGEWSEDWEETEDYGNEMINSEAER